MHTLLAYAIGMEFIEAPAFTRRLPNYLDDDHYSELQAKLAAIPERGDLMPGTGGFRKLRWADARRGKGRRGGLRIIYYYLHSDRQIWLMTLYDKDEVSDLTISEKRALKAAIEMELERRAVRRVVGRRRSRRTH
jgi:mRNA-degrading endonuclease RelE of RelBE toxin-antitoxin system